MELNLNELAATLTIGAFFLFGIELISRNILGRGIVGKFSNNLEPDTKKYTVGALLITLSFIFGMVLEDISNKFVDNNTWQIYLPIVKADDAIKRSVLVRDFKMEEYDKSPLLAESVNRNLIGGPFKEKTASFTDYVKNLQECRKSGNLVCNPAYSLDADSEIEVIKGFYYAAKSEVYRNDNYYDELKRIQLRIDFARSMVVISLFLLFALLFCLWMRRNSIRSLKVKLVAFRHLSWEGKGNNMRLTKFEDFKNKNKNLFTVQKMSRRDFAKPFLRVSRLRVAVFILAVIYSFSGFAYNSEETEFDKRVYGYYLSLKAAPATK